MEKDINTKNGQSNPAANKHDSAASDIQLKVHVSKKKLLIAGAVVLVLAVAGGAFALLAGKEKDSAGNKSSNGGAMIAEGENAWTAGCEGDGRVAMTRLPMDMSDVASITPLGLTTGAHVMPIDHLYFFPKNMQKRDAAQPTPTGMKPAGNQVVGTVLFQVLAGEKLKMEAFPGKTKAQAAAFTSAAQTYER